VRHRPTLTIYIHISVIAKSVSAEGRAYRVRHRDMLNQTEPKKGDAIFLAEIYGQGKIPNDFSIKNK
jgi:hypothetical protein